MYSIVLGGLISLGLIALSILYVKKPKNFGEFKNFFVVSTLKSNFYLLVIILRILLTIGIGMFNSSIIGISLAISAMGI